MTSRNHNLAKINNTEIAEQVAYNTGVERKVNKTRNSPGRINLMKHIDSN